MSSYYIRAEDLRVRVDDVTDKTNVVIYKPYKAKKEAAKRELFTKTGKSLSDPDNSNLYSTNPCPSWNILRRFPACRLTDPADKMASYWLLDDVVFECQDWVKSLHQMGVLTDDDIFVWVYKHQNKEEDDRGPMQLQSESSTTPYVFHVETDTGECKKAAGYIIASSSTSPSYNSSRRSAYLIIRNLGFITSQ